MKESVSIQIEDLLTELEADSSKEGQPWKGCKVIVPVYFGQPIIGYPYVILIKDGEARISTEKESLDYLSYCNGDKP